MDNLRCAERSWGDEAIGDEEARLAQPEVVNGREAPARISSGPIEAEFVKTFFRVLAWQAARVAVRKMHLRDGNGRPSPIMNRSARDERSIRGPKVDARTSAHGGFAAA